MHPFSPPALGKAPSFCGFSALRPISHPSYRFGENPSWNKDTSRSDFHLNFPFLNPPTIPNRGKELRVSAHFSRASRRRNSLREKLLDGEKVRSNPNFHILDVCEKESVSIGSEGDNIGNVTVEKSDIVDESVLWSRLEDWVDQYKKDSEYWGIGSGPIFSIFEDLDGNVSRISVHEDEIIRRQELGGDSPDVNSKIAQAKHFAREAETGKYKFPKNSSIANFVVEGTQSVTANQFPFIPPRSNLFPRLSKIGFVVTCGSFVIWALKRLFTSQNDAPELTIMEKEMLRRKMRLRRERGKMEGGNVEVLPNDLALELPVGPIERPQLDKHQLMKSMLEAKASIANLSIQDSSDKIAAQDRDFDDKILEIREMARQARELERQDASRLSSNGDKDSVSDIQQAVEVETDIFESNADKQADVVVEGSNLDTVSESKSHLHGRVNGDLKVEMDGKKGADFPMTPSKCISADDHTTDGTTSFKDISASEENSGSSHNTKNSFFRVPKNEVKGTQYPSEREIGTVHVSDTKEKTRSCEPPSSKLSPSDKASIKMKPRIIRSVDEARNYLSQSRSILINEEQPGHEAQVDSPHIDPHVHSPLNYEQHNGKAIQTASGKTRISDPSNAEEPNDKASQGYVESLEPSEMLNATSLHTDGIQKRHEANDLSSSGASSSRDSTTMDNISDATPLQAEQSWIEKNFEEFKPLVKKIGVGFQENYMEAKSRVQELSKNGSISQPWFKEDDEELEWMEEDGLREIVFQVRENELAGWEPFHLMDAEDQHAFFKGLERQVEKESEKLLGLHEWVHSRVENLDYGADGISLDDPPERIIPRWKGPPPDKDPDFLNNFVGQRKMSFADNQGISHRTNRDAQDGLQESEEPSSDAMSTTSGVNYLRKTSQNGASTNPRTVIEGSDGSTRAGKKSGKEHWQHTKKWSREFLEAYNSEMDPEIKSVMKDMGQDLNRWITDKEMQEAADLMTRLPKRKRRYIEKKINKLKREMEVFGPQAVVHKYREYSEEKEEDYLWWLDLPFVLCIELYTNEDNVQRVGFYSLEMAADLELDPKQYHVIALEDPGDCKNLCYIIQAHMDVLGNGRAFVVARPPKDAFREAKANGFNITVIRKRELQLNVDQTLEEVEAEITEIGSKMYHDKIMREHGVDMGALMKGVLGSGKTTKRSSRKMPTKPINGQTLSS